MLICQIAEALKEGIREVVTPIKFIRHHLHRHHGHEDEGVAGEPR